VAVGAVAPIEGVAVALIEGVCLVQLLGLPHAPRAPSTRSMFSPFCVEPEVKPY
jgi:hypothetical protein